MSEAQAAPVEQQQEPERTGDNQAPGALTRSPRSKWKVIAAVVIGVFALFLLYRTLSKSGSKEKSAGQRGGASAGGPFSRLLGGIVDFDRSGNAQLERDAGPGDRDGGPVPRKSGVIPGMPSTGAEKETEASLLQLAERLKKNNFTLQGVSHCYWTKVQREMFGDRESSARKVVESIYIECRSQELCPGLKGYPTWVRGDRKWGGFQTPENLRNMCAEMEQKEERGMLQMAPEPVEENLPDEKHNAVAPKLLTPEMARQMMAQMLKDMQANESGNETAGVESDRSADILTPDAAPSGADAVDYAGSTAREGAAGCKEGSGGVKKEFARGVSAYAPLNVPDMPGTAPMNLMLQHPDFQSMQGNAPRAAYQNHAPTPNITEQMVRSFDNLMEQAQRNPRTSSYSQTRMPHSLDITTGDALADKRVPIREQPGSGK